MGRVLTDEEMEALILEIYNARQVYYEEEGEIYDSFDSECYWTVVDQESFEFEVGGNTFKCIECHGGEGEGEHAYTIFQWKGIYYKLTYRYYSYNGYDFDYAKCTEVVPSQKMVTVFS